MMIVRITNNMNLKLKAKIEEAIDKVIQDCCETEDSLG